MIDVRGVARRTRRKYRRWQEARRQRGPLEKMFVQRKPDGSVVDIHQVLAAPTWVDAATADHMRDEDSVMGLLAGGAAWAIPWWVMKNFHTAELDLGGEPVFVVLCEACAGGSAYTPMVRGQRRHFEVEGKFNANHVLRDVETGSLWTPLNGVAVHGRDAGERLPRVTLLQSTWSEWRALHPDTRVVHGEPGGRLGHGSDFPTPWVRDKPRFVDRTRLRVDGRLDDVELMYGVEVGGATKAYLVRKLATGGARHDVVGGVDIVVFRGDNGGESWLVAAFERRVDDRLLTFGPGPSWTTYVDEETGSSWSFTGTATGGPLLGRTLTPVPGAIEKWYAWSSNNPDGVYE
ncbi:MAG: hypothetical protein JWO37_1971 [Acidimicrobiales bacterium]|jgi:hypothetical protein|nr:hypothetical protein [Acidimicrobiales bacterium]